MTNAYDNPLSFLERGKKEIDERRAALLQEAELLRKQSEEYGNAIALLQGFRSDKEEGTEAPSHIDSPPTKVLFRPTPPKTIKLGDAILQVIEMTGRFLHSSEIDEVLNRSKVSVSRTYLSQKLSSMVDDGVLVRVRFDQSHNSVFYGLPSYIVETESGEVDFLSDSVIPTDLTTGRYQANNREFY